MSVPASPDIEALNQSMQTIMETLSYIIKASGLDNPQAYQAAVKQQLSQAEKNRLAAEKYLTDPS
jgi:hypothetical protein